MSSPNVEDNYISIYNTYDYLNDFYSSNFLDDKVKHRAKLDELLSYPLHRKFIFKSSGYLINNNFTVNCESDDFFTLKVETNLRFKILLNNNLVFSNDEFFENLKNMNNLNKNSPDSSRKEVNFYEINSFNSKQLCLNKNSLNQITIFYQFYYDRSLEEEEGEEQATNPVFEKHFSKLFSKSKYLGSEVNRIKAHFIISYIKHSRLNEFKTTDFLPFAPYEKFKLDKYKILNDLEVLTCQVNEKNLNLKEKIKTKVFVCPESCAEAEKESICHIVYEAGIIPNSGGSFIITKQSENLKYYATELPKAGLDYFITDIKLGYEEDFKKFSHQANVVLFKNYIVKIDVNSTLNEDDSFIFYKKDFVISKGNTDNIENINNRNSNENTNSNTNEAYKNTNADVQSNQKLENYNGLDTYVVLNAKVICDNSEELMDNKNQGEFDKSDDNSKIPVFLSFKKSTFHKNFNFGISFYFH